VKAAGYRKRSLPLLILASPEGTDISAIILQHHGNSIATR
jgi:hypothetical protein